MIRVSAILRFSQTKNFLLKMEINKNILAKQAKASKEITSEKKKQRKVYAFS